MTLVVVLGFVAVVGVVVASAARRALVDERQSVRDYQHTLETLRHIGARNASPRATRTGSSARSPSNGVSAPATGNGAHGSSTHAPQPFPTRATTRLASSSGTHRRTRGVAPSAAHDDGLRVMAPGAPPAVAAHVPPAAVGDQTAPVAMQEPTPPAAGPGRRPPTDVARHPVALVAAGAVLLVGVLAAVVLGTSSSPSPRTATRPPVVRAAGGGQRAPAATSPLPAVSSSSTAATYRVPAGPYTIVLSATGLCWVMATNSAGQVLWTGTLTAGETKVVAAEGETRIRLGAASDVTLSAAGRAAPLPPGFQSPFDVTFATT